MRGVTTLCVMVFLTSGCAKAPTYTHSGEPASQLQRDTYECRQEATASVAPVMVDGMMVQPKRKVRRLEAQCMAARGYEVE